MASANEIAVLRELFGGLGEADLGLWHSLQRLQQDHHCELDVTGNGGGHKREDLLETDLQHRRS